MTSPDTGWQGWKSWENLHSRLEKLQSSTIAVQRLCATVQPMRPLEELLTREEVYMIQLMEYKLAQLLGKLEDRKDDLH